MALLNPVYAFIVPFLFLFTVPLAVFAGITTSFAFIVLVFRVILVYLDLALTLLPSYFTLQNRHHRHHHHYLSSSLDKTPSSVSSSSFSVDLSRSPSPVLTKTHSARSLGLANTYRRSRSRRPSSASLAGSVTPIANEGGMGLYPSVGMDRDFEGVGGWRVGDIDDERWTAINSRLELPDKQYGGRHHARSLSGGGNGTGTDGGILMMKGRRRNRSGSPETVVFGNTHGYGHGHGHGQRGAMSPNSSRLRTPVGGTAPAALTSRDRERERDREKEGEYFPSTPSPSKASRKMAIT